MADKTAIPNGTTEMRIQRDKQESIDTSISKKNNDFFLFINQRDIEFCDNHHNAAVIMSVLRAAHRWKIETDARNKKANDIAEQHGDARWLPEDVLVGFSTSELCERTLNFYGRNRVLDGVNILEEKGIISLHANPNKKYKHDQRRYFKFHPEVFTKWSAMRGQNQFDQQDELEELEAIEQIASEDAAIHATSQVTENSDSPKLNRRVFENKLEEGKEFKNKRPPFKNKLTIMNSNKYINNKDQSINTGIDLIDDEMNTNEPDIPQTIVEALMAKGMPENKFFPDTLPAIRRLHSSGATLNQFLEGHDIAERATQGKGFGVNYLIKTVESLLLKAKKSVSQGMSSAIPKSDADTQTFTTPAKERVYENDFRHAKTWAADILAMTDEELMNEFATR